MKVNLVAAQAKTELKDYASAEAFQAKTASLMERAMREVDPEPAYHQYPWNGPCSWGAPGTEGENRLRTNCPSIIQGRENIQYGVNAMMVGAVFEDMEAEGLSSIARNTGRVGASWEEGVIAMAEKPDAEEIVAATVEVVGRG